MAKSNRRTQDSETNRNSSDLQGSQTSDRDELLGGGRSDEQRVRNEDEDIEEEPVLDEEDLEENDLDEEDLDDVEWEEADDDDEDLSTNRDRDLTV